MLTKIHIKKFKGFQDTEITSVRKVNLILGGQNVGKTSLLEAVFLGGSDIGKYQQLPSLFRVAEGRDVQRYLQSVLGKTSHRIDLYDAERRVLRTGVNDFSTVKKFHDISEFKVDGISLKRSVSGPNVRSQQELVLEALTNSNIVKTAEEPHEAMNEISFFNPLAVSVHLPNQLSAVQLFDHVVLSRKKRQLLEMLRQIEPRLEDMHSLSPDGEQRIYAELGDVNDALPLPQLGHGFSRLVYLYCSLLITDAKLALIDEVENGIHYTSLPTLFKGIQDIAAKHTVQTLMTTHSWDCIQAAYKTFANAGALKDFQLIRLERDGDNVNAVVINDEALDTVMEAGYEVR